MGQTKRTYMNLTEQLKRDGHLLARPAPKPKKRYRLKPIGAKRSKALNFYRILRKGHLEKYPVCEAGKVLLPHFKGCTQKSTEIHHAKRRGPHLNDTRYFVAICRPCHCFVETHANLARTLGLLQ